MKFELVCVHEWDWSKQPAGQEIAFCKSLCHREWKEGDPEPRVVLATVEQTHG